MARAAQVEEQVEQPVAPSLEEQVAGIAEALKGMQEVMGMLTQKVLSPEPKDTRVFSRANVEGAPKIPEGAAHYVSDERHLMLMELDMTALDRSERPVENPTNEYIKFTNGNLVTSEQNVIRQLDWMIAGGSKVPSAPVRRIR